MRAVARLIFYQEGLRRNAYALRSACGGFCPGTFVRSSRITRNPSPVEPGRREREDNRESRGFFRRTIRGKKLAKAVEKGVGDRRMAVYRRRKYSGYPCYLRDSEM